MNEQPKCTHCATPLVRAIEIGLCCNCCDRLPKEVERLKSVVEDLRFALSEAVRTDKIGWLQEFALRGVKPPNEKLSDGGHKTI